jgi:flagellar biosynthesis protein FliP
LERNTILSFFKSARNPGHRGQNVIFCISLILAMMVLFPLMGHAFEGSLEKDVQKDIEQGQAIVETIQKKLQTGSSVSGEITQLKKSVENIKISNLRKNGSG